MQVIVTKNLANLVKFHELSRLISSPSTKEELGRGVQDAGRKVKTKVQKAVKVQMALKDGHYSSYVVANTRGTPDRANLAFHIRASMKGAQIEAFKGLRALSPTGAVAKKMNAGRSAIDAGTVRSGVWNRPRTFKRSFTSGGGFFALRPGKNGRTSAKLPKAFWTFGNKNQPRGAGGRFVSRGQKGFTVRKLYGPALGKELDKDMSLSTFLTEGPKELEIQVEKRIARIMRW